MSSVPLCVRCGDGLPMPRDHRLFDPGPPLGAPRITTPEELADVVVPPLAGLDREHCLLVCMDIKHRVRGLRTVTVGTVSETFMEPREIFRDALLAGAVVIAVAHNHPSGDPRPSDQDRGVTRRLVRAAEIVGIALLDHVIVGGPGNWRSMGRMGLL